MDAERGPVRVQFEVPESTSAGVYMLSVALDKLTGQTLRQASGFVPFELASLCVSHTREAISRPGAERVALEGRRIVGKSS